MARLSADITMIDSRAITYLKGLVFRLVLFTILSFVVVYVVTDYSIQDTLFLDFVIAFTLVLMGITMTLEVIARLYSWLWNHFSNPNG